MNSSPFRFLTLFGLLTLLACGGGGSSSQPPPVSTAPTITAISPTHGSVGSTVAITGTNLTGATSVQFNGLAAFSFSVTSATQITAVVPAAATSGAIRITTPNGTVSSSTFTVDAPPAGSPVQVLMNAGFEQSSPVIWQGDTGTIQPAPGTSEPRAVPHGGTNYSWLGGYGSVVSDHIFQDFFIPASATAASATFYLKIYTDETGSVATDTVTVTAMDTTNAVLGTLLTKSNLDAAAYTAFTVDLMAFKGQVVRLSFKSQEDAQNATSFLLDDVAANITVPAPTDLKPLITGFTPTSGIPGEVSVQINGGNFFGVTGLTIGGVNATYVLADGTRLSASLPVTAAMGSAPITMINAQGTGTSASPFTVTYGVPTVTSVNPTQGPIGTPVVVVGTYLGYPGTTVTLNGQAVAMASQSANQITFTIPAGATSGNLVITTSGGTQTRTFTVNTASTTLDLHVDRAQLTQSTQTLDNAVPVIAGKDGLIRVFVLANQTNAATPQVQVTLMNNGIPVAGYPKTLAAPGLSVPLALDEALLANSWNLVVPGTDLTTPTGSGYSVQAQVDPANGIVEADETNNTTAATFGGATVPAFKTTIFPVVLSTGTGNVSLANKDEWAARLAKMYPISSVDVAVGASFTGSVSTLASDGTGWDTLLSELTAKHLADAVSDRYYFGALAVDYSSGVAGLGWVPSASTYSFKYRTAIGWDKTGYSDGGNFPEVYAHEVGHNMGRQHSPCGGAGNPDPAYPYAGALIGKWGYDNVLNQLYSPLTTKDIMAYCKPNWVSDYVYAKILDFRGGTGGFRTVGAEDAPLPKHLAVAQDCLLVRGIVHEDGKVVFLPSFRTRALPSPMASGGEFTLECQDEQGATLFSTSLDLMELGCWPKGHERHFAMALPLNASAMDRLAALKVLQREKVVSSVQSLPKSARVVSTSPEARRVQPDRLQLTWDATLQPAALVRDADSGEVIAILSGGQRSFPTKAKRLEVVLSDGVNSQTFNLGPLE